MKARITLGVKVRDDEMDNEGEVEEYFKMILGNGAASIQVDSIDVREIY